MFTEQPLVSVLMTCYNREQYIASAIESVLSSTYKNLELIVVDDRSTDKTVAIAQWFENNDSRVRVFINDTNLGDYPNRNKAATYALGKYLKYVDSDDLIYPWGLEILINCMEKFPQAGWGLCSLEPNSQFPFPIELSPKEAYEYNYLGPGLFHKAPLSSIIRREIFFEVGGFLPGRMVSDFEMWHRLAFKYRVLLMQDGIVWNRIHEGQEMSDYVKYEVDYENIIVRYLRSKQCPLGENESLNILRSKRKQAVWGVARAALHFNLTKIKIQMEKIRLHFGKVDEVSNLYELK